MATIIDTPMAVLFDPTEKNLKEWIGTLEKMPQDNDVREHIAYFTEVLQEVQQDNA